MASAPLGSRAEAVAFAAAIAAARRVTIGQPPSSANQPPFSFSYFLISYVNKACQKRYLAPRRHGLMCGQKGAARPAPGNQRTSRLWGVRRSRQIVPKLHWTVSRPFHRTNKKNKKTLIYVLFWCSGAPESNSVAMESVTSRSILVSPMRETLRAR